MEKIKDKFSRNQKEMIGITKVLTENPNKVITLNLFTEKFNAAKSTISEHIVIVREVLETLSMENRNSCRCSRWNRVYQ